MFRLTSQGVCESLIHTIVAIYTIVYVHGYLVFIFSMYTLVYNSIVQTFVGNKIVYVSLCSMYTMVNNSFVQIFVGNKVVYVSLCSMYTLVYNSIVQTFVGNKVVCFTL